MNNEINTNLHTIIFNGKNIRKVLHKDEWWFVINDLVEALTDISNPADYIKKLKTRDSELSKGWGQIVISLPVDTLDGKQNLSCANTEGIFRIIQSIPSPKAEPFKKWLAKIGYERIQKIEDLELALNKIRTTYMTNFSNEDQLNDLELILSKLNKTSITKEATQKTSQGFKEYMLDPTVEKNTESARKFFETEKPVIDTSGFISHKLIIDMDDV
jgi:prophage antirepressor-like protein